MAIAAQFGMVAHLVDGTNAFVGSALDRPNYIAKFEGLEDFDSETADTDCVLELLSSLYGLCQSAYLWHRKCRELLNKISFQKSTADSSLFTNARGVIIAVYVDDIVIIGKDETEIGNLKQKLNKFHPMKDYGRLSKILGIRFQWLNDGISCDQETYTNQILEEFEMKECKTKGTPAVNSMLAIFDSTDCKTLDKKEHWLFRRMIGRMMFLACATRPDIAFGVNRLAQYLAYPRQVHLQGAKHLLRYLKGSASKGLFYSKRKGEFLTGFADSAYANATGRKSTSGYISELNGGAISWASKKQQVTGQSTTEAEYVSCRGCEAMYLDQTFPRKHQ